jgi:peptidoglycan hydrolase CwlO-like protein
MNGTLRTASRRAAVAAGVAGSIGLGAAPIVAAGQWTAASAPLAPPAVTSETLASQLAAEQARGAELQARLEAQASQVSGLQAALDAANAQVKVDDATAADLRARIAAAQAKLAALNKQIAAAAAAAANQPQVTHRTVVTVQGTAKPAPTHATTGASGAAAASGDGGVNDN